MIYFKFTEDNDSLSRRQIQHAAGISLLREGVKKEYGIDITEDDISREELGKPYFHRFPHIHFSISHCSGLAVCVISGSRCGIDAEPLRQPREAVAKRIMSPEELDFFSKLPDNDKPVYFTSVWTAKEAYAKFDGRGISVMKKAVIHEGNIKNEEQLRLYQWQLLPENYFISLCTNGDMPTFACDQSLSASLHPLCY